MIFREFTVIKISYWISGVWIFLSMAVILMFSLRPDSMHFISIIGLSVVLFGLSYLGGHIIRRNKGAIRLGVLISVLWVAGLFAGLEPGYREGWADFFGLGIIPVISYFGTLWVISGFLPKKKEGDKLKGVIRKTTGQIKEDEKTISEREALREALRMSAVAARKALSLGDKAGVAKEKARFQEIVDRASTGRKWR